MPAKSSFLFPYPLKRTFGGIGGEELKVRGDFLRVKTDD
jgi:hypothetical protein